MGYRPKHFILQELVGPAIYKARGERAWELLQVPLLVTLDQLREKFGSTTVNNWHAGGAYSESGLRDFDTATGAKWSMHKFGGAADCKFKGVTPAEVGAYILAHQDEFPQLTTIEDPRDTPSWTHVDCRNHSNAGIWVVRA